MSDRTDEFHELWQKKSFRLLFTMIKEVILLFDWAWVRFMVFNATFNNISVISWWSVLLVEETGIPGENHQPAASH
jgi:hypothetical protein